MARNAMHDEVAADPRTVPHTYQGRGDRCRWSINQETVQWERCSRHGTWLILGDGVELLRCTQHAHAWIQAHPLVEGP